MEQKKLKLGQALSSLMRNDDFKLLINDYLNDSLLAIVYDGGSDKTITEETTARYIFKNYIETIVSDFEDYIAKHGS